MIIIKLLLSINKKFFNVKASQFINQWKEIDYNSLIDGCEIYVNKKETKEKRYLYNLSKQIKVNNWILQIHAPEINEIDINLLRYYQNIAELSGQNLIITSHPVKVSDKKQTDIFHSYAHFYKVLNLIKKNNLDITLVVENLNNLNGINRCNLSDITQILENIDDLHLCWDIGHEVDNNECNYKLKESLVPLLKNIHIHDIEKSDHYPFYYGRTDLNKTLSYLKEINYKNNIVLEIALDYLKGSSYIEKQKEYINQFQMIKDILE